MIQLLMAAVAVGSSLYQGNEARKSSDKQGNLLQEQGKIKYDEALFEAEQTREDADRFEQEQMMQYVGAGVEMAGTPLLVMAETIRMGETEADAIERRGRAEMALANANAKITRSTGKAQMIASIGSAVQAGASTYKSAGGKV